MAAKLKFHALRGSVLVKDADGNVGAAFMLQNEELPSNLADGELDRLKKIGAVGEGDAPTGPADLREQESETPRATRAPKQPAVDLSALAEMNDEQLATLYAEDTKVSGKALVDAVGDNAELAERILAAEKTHLKGDARKSVVEPLEKVAAARGDDEQ